MPSTHGADVVGRPPCGRAGSCRSPRSTRRRAAAAPRHEHVRVPAVERVVVVHEPEVADPSIDPEQVERRRRTKYTGVWFVRKKCRIAGMPVSGADATASRRRGSPPATPRVPFCAALTRLGGSCRPDPASAEERACRRSTTSRTRTIRTTRPTTQASQLFTPGRTSPARTTPSPAPVCTTDGRYTRSPTPWAACGVGAETHRRHTTDVAEHGRVGRARGGNEAGGVPAWTAKALAERGHQRMIVGDDRSLGWRSRCTARRPEPGRSTVAPATTVSIRAFSSSIVISGYAAIL